MSGGGRRCNTDYFGDRQASGVLSEQGSGQKQGEGAEGNAAGRRGVSWANDSSGDHNGQ